MAFVDKMIADKGLELSADQTQKLRAKLLGDLDMQIEQAIIRALPDDKLAELSRLADDPQVSDQAIEDLFNGSGVDFQTVATRTMKDFQLSFLAKELDEATIVEMIANDGGAKAGGVA